MDDRERAGYGDSAVSDRPGDGKETLAERCAGADGRRRGIALSERTVRTVWDGDRDSGRSGIHQECIDNT